MPTVNAYVATEQQQRLFLSRHLRLRERIAQELSCCERTLQPDEVTLRVIIAPVESRLSEVELDIAAHAYSERVAQQDEICSRLVIFLEEELGMNQSKVWLALCELGHSMI